MTKSKKKKSAPSKNGRSTDVPSANTPDWKISGRVYGGDLYDIPQPHIWCWPNNHGIRRSVDVNITTWRGISLDALHFYAKVRPEQNMVWDSRELAWRVPGRGVDVSGANKEWKADANVFTRADAVAFVRAVVTTFFMDETKFLVRHGPSGIDGWPAVEQELQIDVDD